MCKVWQKPFRAQGPSAVAQACCCRVPSGCIALITALSCVVIPIQYAQQRMMLIAGGSCSSPPRLPSRGWMFWEYQTC